MQSIVLSNLACSPQQKAAFRGFSLLWRNHCGKPSIAQLATRPRDTVAQQGDTSMNDTELMLDVGQANELKLAFRRAGYTNAEIKKLCEGDVLARLLPVVKGYAEVTTVTHAIDCDADPLIPYEGWKVESHKKGGLFVWDPSKVVLHLSENQKDGKCIVGNKLRKELADVPMYNANVLDYLVKHPHLIPEEWKGKVVFFWDTIYRGSGDRLYVRCLVFGGGHWQANYGWLNCGWDGYYPAARRAS